MLIASPRHRPEDLRLWAELEAADRETAVSRYLSKQAEGAMELFALSSSTPCFIATSWGKDSVVMLHHFVRSNLNLPVVYVRKTRRDNPDCEIVRDTFLTRFPIDRYHERTFTDAQCAREEHWRDVAAEFGARRITGLRADESRSRLLSIGSAGVSTKNSCRPLSHWRSAHVFAYLAQHDLPVHPAYACLGGGRWPREHLRTHSLAGTGRGIGMGRAEWEREYYGDELRRIAATTDEATA